ncbi:MAG: transcript cleavage factor [Chlamydiae bacterium CG10_big_fil_rev_8_21_14_0_10_42_34]|nr:MAG: transcript cleavage factor [Chlamydiae bacterium CG10_big_fil_rev_8_21_14_0_10_42_34]
MAYLKDFRQRIQNNDYPGFLKIWEEYCYGDQPDGEEIVAVLEFIKTSELAKPFGVHVERILPLWRELKDFKQAHDALRLIFDLQTTNSEELADLATEYLKSQNENDPLLFEKFRLIGLRNRERFQAAIRNFELLTHMKKGNFVFHTSGWGTGEIIDVSLVREEVSLEFEYVMGPQHLSFEKAFKTLLVLPPDHFYARRFGNPDALEKEARDNPSETIRLLLRDLGPKTAAEIKEEICDLVIPAEDWNRWWQTTRAKLKKDTKIECPKELKEKFKLLAEDVPHEVALHKALEAKPGVNATIQMVYAFLRDFPETLKNGEFKASLESRFKELLSEETLNESQKLQVLFFLEDLGLPKIGDQIKELIGELQLAPEIIRNISVMGFQKRALLQIKKLRKDWSDIYLDLLFTVDQNLLRDFILSELDTANTKDALKQKLNSLLIHPLSFPEVFVWYFPKIIDKKSKLPFSDASGKNRFFEGLMIILDFLDQKPQYRDLSKKIIAIITKGRYKVVRDIMQHSSIEEVKEYLLLATKCGSLSDHDIKILHSLGEVVFPALARNKKEKDRDTSEDDVIWTTQEGYKKTQARIQQIATVETVSNAREIEAARALGDLRENAEFKAALEKRDRLQSELKFLSDQINKARILTPQDVLTEEVSVGSVVHCSDSKGEHLRYTLLGPWDADPENHILSFQSKLAQSMKERTIGEKFEFQGETFTITDIDNYFDQNH